jgi:transcriptional antiterminator NusG
VKRWYAVHTYSGHEQKVRDKLEKKIAEAKLEDRFGQIVIAKEEFVEMKDGKRRTAERKLFPGYILVEMEIDDETRFLVTSTTGVLSFIGTTSGPQPLEQEDIDRILGRIERKPSKERPEIPYQVGEQVRVIDGPFTGFQGLVDDVDGERGKIKVMVSIFGRATPVELDFLQVESA